MEFFDFYKLLNIPVGTPIEDVKKAYILKVNQYSGAYNNGDEKAAEYLRIISRGYELLSNPESKRVYDLMVLSHYLKQKNSDINRSLYRKYGSSERNPTKDEALDAEEGAPQAVKPITEEQLHIAKKGVIQEKIQLGVACAGLILLFFIFDNIFWKPYTDITMISYVFLIIGYIILMIWTLMKMYRYFEVRNLILQKKVSTEKWILVSFLVMFFALPMLSLRIESWRRSFHLSRYAVETRATDFALEDGWLTVEFKANNGKNYKQSVSLGDNATHFKKNNYDRLKFTIIYSSENPKIIEVKPQD